MLAEAADAPGPLHYLLEEEGFRILGSASNEDELTRILSQSLEPDVVVVDAAVPAVTAMVAHEFAPDSELIVIWPEGIVPPVAADQVFPDLVFEELGPAVRRAAERNRLRRPAEDEAVVIAPVALIEPEDEEPVSAAAARTAGRVLVGTVALIAAIILTMGASFALQGLRAAHRAPPSRIPTTTAPGLGVGSLAIGSGARASGRTDPVCDADHRSGQDEHASAKAQDQAACANSGGSHAADQRHDGRRHETGVGSGQGDQGGSGQGDQGSGNGQGSGQGDQGSGQSQGSSQGDQGSGQGDQGGSGQGDQGGSGQGDQGTSQGDQGTSQGDQGTSQGDQQGGGGTSSGG